MAMDEQKRDIRRDQGLAAALLATGTLIAGISLAVLVVRDPLQMAELQTAQAVQGTTPGTPPLQGTPAPADSGAPAESKPGGTRPTTPAPEPAQPGAKAQSEGAKAALPPAPAEKMAPPIQQK